MSIVSVSKRPASEVFTEESQVKSQKTEEKSFLERLMGLPGGVVAEIFSYLTGPEKASWNRVSRAANQLFTNNLEGIWQKYWNQKGGVLPITGKGYTESVQTYRQEFRDLKALIGKYKTELDKVPEDIKKIVEGRDNFSIENIERLRNFCKARDTLICWDVLAGDIGAQVDLDWSSSDSVVAQAGKFSDWFLKNEQQLTQITELVIGSRFCATLPSEIARLTNLKKLDLSENQLQTFPAGIEHLSKLEDLDLSQNLIESLPPKIGCFPQLWRLDLGANKLKTLPREIGDLSNLIELDLYENQLENLPPEIGRLSKLWRLNLYTNELKTLPSEIGSLSILEDLDVTQNPLESLPEELRFLTLSLSGHPKLQ